MTLLVIPFLRKCLRLLSALRRYLRIRSETARLFGSKKSRRLCYLAKSPTSFALLPSCLAEAIRLGCYHHVKLHHVCLAASIWPGCHHYTWLAPDADVGTRFCATLGNTRGKGLSLAMGSREQVNDKTSSRTRQS